MIFPIISLYSQIICGSMEDQLLDSINSYRLDEKLPELKILSSLQKAADRQARIMCTKGMLSHSGLNSSEQRLDDRLRNVDFVGEAIGENIARQPKDNIEEVVKAWMDSKEHRKNILGKFDHTGIGTCKDRQGNRYWAQVFGKKSKNTSKDKHGDHDKDRDKEGKHGDHDRDRDRDRDREGKHGDHDRDRDREGKRGDHDRDRDRDRDREGRHSDHDRDRDREGKHGDRGKNPRDEDSDFGRKGDRNKPTGDPDSKHNKDDRPDHHRPDDTPKSHSMKKDPSDGPQEHDMEKKVTRLVKDILDDYMKHGKGKPDDKHEKDKDPERDKDHDKDKSPHDGRDKPEGPKNDPMKGDQTKPDFQEGRGGEGQDKDRKEPNKGVEIDKPVSYGL